MSERYIPYMLENVAHDHRISAIVVASVDWQRSAGEVHAEDIYT